MIQLSQFDYDTAVVSVKYTKEGGKPQDYEIHVISSFCEEAIRSMSLYDQCISQAEASGVELLVETENHGIKLKEFSETYKKLRAQLAESIVKDWPIDDTPFETLLQHQSLCNAIIKASQDRGEEFLKKQKP